MKRLRVRGFTLIELLVVMAIIAILIALLLPAVQAAREAARRTQCMNNIRQIALALANYETSQLRYPPGRLGCDGMGIDVCAGNPNAERVGTSGFVMILPQLEQQSLYDKFDFSDGPWVIAGSAWVAKNGVAVGTRPSVLVCPADESKPFVIPDMAFVAAGVTAATGSYVLNMGSNGPTYGIDGYLVKLRNNGIFYYRESQKISTISDGLSSTIFVGESIENHTLESQNVWSQGGRHLSSQRSTDNPLNTKPGTGVTVNLYGYRCNGAFGSRHTNGASFAFGDGHVTFITDHIDLPTYRALSTRSGNDTVKGNY